METLYEDYCLLEDKSNMLLHSYDKLLPDYTASHIPELSLIKEFING
jgi:hypothetical protein